LLSGRLRDLEAAWVEAQGPDPNDNEPVDTAAFVAEGDTVVIFGSEAGTVKATGQAFRNVWSQKYVVRDGLIVEMAEYNLQVEPRG
jgi:ketosteroid isomerase-like protein